MDIYQLIRSYMTPSWMAGVIERMPTRKSVIVDRVFARKENNASAYADLNDIERIVGSVPVVSRGGASLNAAGSSITQSKIEPMPIRLHDGFTGARLNDLKNFLGDGGMRGQALVKAEIDRVTRGLIADSQKTRDALCAQALTGKIDYQMRTEDGFTRYKVNFGSTLSYTPTKLWNAADIKIGLIVKQLIEMRAQLRAQGHAGNIGFMAGIDAWTDLANLVEALPNDSRSVAKIDGETITVNGFSITLNDGAYSDRNSGGTAVVKSEVDAGKLVAWVEDVPMLGYYAVDDLDSNLEPMPIFVKPIKMDDPSGIKIVSESKPLPLVAPKAILWATVRS